MAPGAKQEGGAPGKARGAGAETISYDGNGRADTVSYGKSGIVLARTFHSLRRHEATPDTAPADAPEGAGKGKPPVAIILYSLFCLVWWLIMWLGDGCRVKYGFSCADDDAANLTLRMLAMLFLYLGALPLMLTVRNRGNGPFLKRMAFHLQYGLMAMIGCGMARNPPPPADDEEEDAGEGESWYVVGDRLFLFLCFLLLFAYTAHSDAGEAPPAAMVQPPHRGHGAVPRTFLLVFGLAGILPLVKKYPLNQMVPEDVEVTERARFFYAMTQGAGLAVLMVVFVPLHFGTDEDQWDTTVTLIVLELMFGIVMFRGEAWNDWINPSLHTQLLLAPLAFLGLAVVTLVFGARAMKRKKEKKEAREAAAATSDDYALAGDDAESKHGAVV